MIFKFRFRGLLSAASKILVTPKTGDISHDQLKQQVAFDGNLPHL